MNFIREYWPQLVAFITLVMALTTMKVDIDVLKDKVATLFKLCNKEKGVSIHIITTQMVLTRGLQ